jgi:ankyrin repeat protein
LEELDEALGSLPATLEETYERALSAVEEKRREGFCYLLRWLSFSARPMQLGEVTEILAIDFSAKPRPLYDPRRRFINGARYFHRHSNLVSVLIVKTKSGQHQELRLAHLSVRDYLLSKKIVGSPVSYFAINRLSAHRSIAEACIVYLQRFQEPDELEKESPDAHSLARYAARFWSYHVQAATAAATNQRSSVDALSTTSVPATAPLIFLIIEFLIQISRIFGLSLPVSQEVSQEKDIPTDLNQLCVELLSAQLQCQIRFFDPDTPWIDKPNVSRSIKALPSSLYYAAHTGLTDSVRELLAQGMNVNAVGGRYGTALQAASCKGFRDVVALLLENGANVNLFGGDYGYALQASCCHGHDECVRLLLDHGANVNAKGGEHFTPLLAAAFNGHDHVVETLIQNGADIEAANPDDLRTPLIEAAAEGHTTVVELLLKHGANILAKDSGGWTALDESAPPGFDSVVRVLIEHNPAILESRDNRGNSALHHTAGQHHVSTIALLLESGIEVNAKESTCRSALYKATKSGNKAVIELLLKFGADIFSKDLNGWTVLHVAAFHDQADIGELFLQRGAEINDGPHGWSPLHIAVLKKNINFVELLLDHNADVKVMTSDGLTILDCIDLHDTHAAEVMARRLQVTGNFMTFTGLRIAALCGYDARIRDMLERGADINASDEGGVTALMWAACGGRSSTMRLLIEYGADVNARNDEGQTVMDYISMLDEDLNAFILEHGYKEEQSTALAEKQISENLLARETLDEIRELITSRMLSKENIEMGKFDEQATL